MATDKNDRQTLDLEHNLLDRAIRAVRDYQKGACTTSFVRAAVRAIPAEDLATLALATRVPAGRLEELRKGS